MQLMYKERFFITSLLFSILSLNLIAQTSDSIELDLEDVEIDFLFNYYQQDGNNSAVTGGIGTEELSNIGPAIFIKVPTRNNYTINASGGVDAYSSASSDNVSNPLQLPNQISGASANDQRFYGNMGIEKENKPKNLTYDFGLGGSIEYDVFSISANGGFSKTSEDNNRTFSFTGSYFYDKWRLIYPVELRNGNKELLDKDIRQSINTSASYSFIINKKLNASITADITSQFGLLSTPFHRVYFNNVDASNIFENREDLLTSSNIERLPDFRIKFPIAFRFNYSIGSFMILKNYYRVYYDSWNVLGNTYKIELPIKATQWLRFYPFYRIHHQTAADYFSPFAAADISEEFFTSDFDLSNFISHKAGMGISIEPLYGFFRFKGGKNKINLLKSLELRYAYYTRNNGLEAHMITFGAKYLIQR